MKSFPLCAAVILSLILLSATSILAVPQSGQDNRIEWTQAQHWPTGTKVLDMVHSLDGKYVFVLTDKQTVEVFTRDGKLQGSIPVEDGVSAIDIAPQGEALYLIDNKNQTFSAVAVSFVVDVDISGSPVTGPADAPVTMVLFTDFECPYCKKAEPLFSEILKRNPKTVKLVFKNMPLKFHKMAMPSARAAMAAREQGKFWEFQERLFAVNKLSMDAINQLAADLNLDMKRFEADMASAKIQNMINKDLIDAQKAGVTGTPTVYINGRVPQQRSLEAFQAVIDDELRKLGKS